jgi:hypothetical protein
MLTYTDVYMHRRAYKCVALSMYVCICMRIDIKTVHKLLTSAFPIGSKNIMYIHTYIYAYIHTSCSITCWRAPFLLDPRIFMYIHTYIHTYVYTYMLTYIHHAVLPADERLSNWVQEYQDHSGVLGEFQNHLVNIERVLECAWMYVHGCACVHVCMFVYMCVCVCVCVWVCDAKYV